MINYKSIMKKIDIIFWSILGILVVYKVVSNDYETIQNISHLNLQDYINIIGEMLITIPLIALTTLLDHYFILVIYLGIKLAYRKYIKGKLDTIDFKNDLYYRDIIKIYSPGVLSYIDDFQLDEKDIVASLLSLELKGKIKLKDKIKILNESEDNLSANEVYIFRNIKNNTLDRINIHLFETLVLNDCHSHQLLVKKENADKQMKEKLILNIIIFIITFIIISNLKNILNSFYISIIMVILLITSVLYFFTSIIYFKSYQAMNKLNPYIRNKKAQAINQKLEGLKKYIKDFSILDERKKEELILWEDYLIYSVLFGTNEKIVADITNIIKN